MKSVQIFYMYIYMYIHMYSSVPTKYLFPESNKAFQLTLSGQLSQMTKSISPIRWWIAKVDFVADIAATVIPILHAQASQHPFNRTIVRVPTLFLPLSVDTNRRVKQLTRTDLSRRDILGLNEFYFDNKNSYGTLSERTKLDSFLGKKIKKFQRFNYTFAFVVFSWVIWSTVR